MFVSLVSPADSLPRRSIGRCASVVLLTLAIGALPHATSAAEPPPLASYANWVTGLAFSPDGNTLASVGGQSLLYRPGEIKLWDAATGQLKATLGGHGTMIWAVAFSPNGQILATAGYDGTLKLWDVAGAKEIASLPAHKHWIAALAFSPDGQTLATASEDATVKLWNLAAMPPAEFFREKPLGNNGPAPKHAGRVPKSVLLGACRDAVEEFRKLIISGQDVPGGREGMEGAVSALALEKARKALAPSLVPVVNGTGVVVHTNLGRSILAEKALAHALSVSCGYSNLEYDLADGGRGSRFVHVEGLLKELTGAEAAFVVNNNAAAVLLCIDTLARGKKVIVSRGELVEIGGSFRIPEVMAKGGADLCEVGTTNRTHPADYERAIDADTGLLLKAHTSNFAVVGFTASVSLADLCRMGREHGIPVMEDLGSGSLLDLSAYGLSREPTVGDSVAAGEIGRAHV